MAPKKLKKKKKENIVFRDKKNMTLKKKRTINQPREYYSSSSSSSSSLPPPIPSFLFTYDLSVVLRWSLVYIALPLVLHQLEYCPQEIGCDSWYGSWNESKRERSVL